MAEKIRHYRNWSNIEDTKLVEAMVDAVNSGAHKADNGFKIGFVTQLEKALKVSLPNSKIFAKPHIESRLKTLKRDWQTVYDMLHGSNTSGFGYDSSNKCVTAEESVWEAYLQSHKRASKWKNKSYPYYEDLCYVYGKDRAHGNQARDFEGLEEHVDMEVSQMHGEEQESDENNPTIDSRMPSQECSSQGSRKRKGRGDPLVDAINNAAVILGDRLGKASEKLGDRLVKVEMELHEKTSMVGSELAKMNLTSMEKFTALRKITRERQTVLNFWNYDGEEREVFVRYLLQE